MAFEFNPADYLVQNAARNHAPSTALLGTGQPAANELINSGVIDAANNEMQRYNYLTNIQRERQLAQENAKREIMNTLLNPNAQQNASPQGYLSPAGRNLANGLIATKENYAAANAMQGETAQRAMQAASDEAEDLRKIGEALGLDLSAYGRDVSLRDARNAMRLNDYRTLQGILGGTETSDEVYDRVYRELRAKGFSKEKSAEEAGYRAGRHKAKRIADFQSAIGEYGLTDRNGLNPLGVQTVMMLSQESPETANAYLKAFPGVKDDYAYNNQIELLERQNAQRNGELLTRAALNRQAAEEAFTRGRQAAREDREANFRYAQQAAEANDRRTRENVVWNKNLALEYMEKELGIKNRAQLEALLDRYTAQAELMRRTGYDDDAINAAITRAISKDSGVGNKIYDLRAAAGKSDDKISAKDKESLNRIKAMFDRITGGNYYPEGSELADLQSDMDDFMNAHYDDEELTRDLQRMKYAAQLHAELQRIRREGTDITDKENTKNARDAANALKHLNEAELRALGFTPSTVAALANR